MKIDATNIIEYTYEDFVEGIKSIANQIQHSDFKPDILVGIVRGGAVPAVYLSHALNKPVQMLHWSYRDFDICETNAFIPEDINAGIKVLIVDDIVDGGDTIKSLLEDWQSSVNDKLVFDNIRVVSMIYNTSQDVKVDFYHREINREEDSRWVIFPWES